jgi:hypothetical protein
MDLKTFKAPSARLDSERRIANWTIKGALEKVF